MVIQANVFIMNGTDELLKVDCGQWVNKMQELGYGFGQYNFMQNNQKNTLHF